MIHCFLKGKVKFVYREEESCVCVEMRFPPVSYWVMVRLKRQRVTVYTLPFFIEGRPCLLLTRY